MVSIRLIRLDQGLNVEHDLPSENFNFGQIGDQAGNPPHKKRLELFLIILLLEQVRHHSKRIEPDVVLVAFAATVVKTLTVIWGEIRPDASK